MEQKPNEEPKVKDTDYLSKRLRETPAAGEREAAVVNRQCLPWRLLVVAADKDTVCWSDDSQQAVSP
jgi:hypothetical protein